MLIIDRFGVQTRMVEREVSLSIPAAVRRRGSRFRMAKVRVTAKLHDEIWGPLIVGRALFLGAEG